VSITCRRAIFFSGAKNITAICKIKNGLQGVICSPRQIPGHDPSQNIFVTPQNNPFFPITQIYPYKQEYQKNMTNKAISVCFR
jgi:hypothetical protein